MSDYLVRDRIDSYPTRAISGYGVRAGRPVPLGASMVPGGVNFAVYSDHATALTLVLYRRGERQPMVEIPIPPEFRLGSIHSIIVYGLDYDDLEYGYRADGPWDPAAGMRFDGSRVLADPYARLVTGRDVWDRPPDWSEPYQYRSRLLFDDFDWEDDRPLRRPLDELVELGVNAVELMPIFEFDEHENSRIDPRTGARLHNYWGYSTHSFFAPKAGFALSGRFGLQADELKNTVKALHRAGIEVILDVVFNHTSEGNEAGPIISFRGLDNATWYMLTPDGNYYNFSGTGNTVNCNHPVVRGFVLECLRYWAAEFHIDGFRFDLASILSRDVHGAPLPNPPLLESIAYDPVLRHCKLIAEAWDAGGLNEVGRFPAYGRWSEWNGCYRDAVRRFVKGDPGVVGEMASRLVGSPDLYAGRGPLASVNFVTAHDGFTLADLVSYNEKHNDANGEDSQDGTNDNLSWNCGAEGPTDDRAVLELRRRQVRNFLALLFASHGVPMLLGGDELGRSQDGNNNAYCHDNEQVWLDWRLVERNADLLRFTRNLIALRRRHPALRRTRHPTGDRVEGLDVPEVSWHGRWPDQPDWSWESRLLVVMQATADPAPDAVLVLANAHWEAAEVRLPEPPTGQAWHLAVDTAAGSGFDSYQPGTEPRLADLAREGRDPGVFLLGPRTVAVLVGAAHDTGGTG